VGSAVWKLYQERHADDDASFVRKVQALGRETPEQLILRLGVREELSPARRRGRAPASTPYARAIAAFSRLASSLHSAALPSPSEVAHLLSEAQIEMRTGALEATRGASELLAMDDVLPIYVFVLSRSEVLYPFALAAYAEDALSPQSRLGADGWAVRLLESSARYIAYELESNGSCDEGEEGSTDEEERALASKSCEFWGCGEDNEQENVNGLVVLATIGRLQEPTEAINVSEQNVASDNAVGAFAQADLDDSSLGSDGGVAVCWQTMSDGPTAMRNAVGVRGTQNSPCDLVKGVDRT